MKNGLLLITILILLLAGCSSSPPRNSSNVCSVFDQKRGWYKDASKASKRWGTPVHVLMAIIRHESSFRSDAKPPRKKVFGFIPAGRPSSAYGYAQALDSTWKSYKRATGHRFADRDDFDDAVDFVGWYTAESSKKLGISKWDARAQYLAYHEGHGGYARGTYRSKRWLLNVANRVQQTASNYATQLKACRG